MAHETPHTHVEPIKDGTPIERSEYWRIVNDDAASAFASLQATGTVCIRFGRVAPDVLHAVDELCRLNGVEVKVVRRADIGVAYYLPAVWAGIAQRRRDERAQRTGRSAPGLWDRVRSIRDHLAA